MLASFQAYWWLLIELLKRWLWLSGLPAKYRLSRLNILALDYGCSHVELQASSLWCPGHTIQFLNYGCIEYLRKALELATKTLQQPVLMTSS